MPKNNKNSSRKRPNNKGSRRNTSDSRLSLASQSVDQFRGTESVQIKSIGFPDRLGTYLRYNQIGVAAGAVSPALQQYRLNSLYDPDLTGAGHQPSYYDVLSLVYNQYYVRGAQFKIEFVNQTTVGLIGVVYYAPEQTSTQTVEQLSESKFAKRFVVGPSTGNNTKTITMPYMTISEIWGQRITESDSDFYSSVTTSPINGVYVAFRLIAADGSTSISCAYRAELVYDSLFKQVAVFASS
jgi:hypothetical protein